jgi:hypothetical protein
MSNNFEIKKQLYEVYKKYKQKGFMPESFTTTLDSFYGTPDPAIFNNRIKGYVDNFDPTNKGASVYSDLINDWKKVFDGEVVTTTEEKSEPETVVEPKKVERPVVTKPVEESPAPKVAEKPTPEEKKEPVKTVVVEKPSVKSEPIPRQTKQKSKYSNLDLSSKTVKVPIANGLIDLFDKTISDSSRDFLMSSGELTNEELIILSENENNTSVFKNHDFNLTRSDLFSMLVLLGLNHLNVSIADSVIQDIFEDNDLKIDYYNWLMNTNMVELDVQNRVKQLQQKLEKTISSNEQIEIMLAHLLLERANVPKDKNRETIKQFLDTSSIMNQSVDAFSVLNGVVSSKIKTIKDYKRARGE